MSIFTYLGVNHNRAIIVEKTKRLIERSVAYPPSNRISNRLGGG